MEIIYSDSDLISKIKGNLGLLNSSANTSDIMVLKKMVSHILNQYNISTKYVYVDSSRTHNITRIKIRFSGHMTSDIFNLIANECSNELAIKGISTVVDTGGYTSLLIWV